MKKLLLSLLALATFSGLPAQSLRSPADALENPGQEMKLPLQTSASAITADFDPDPNVELDEIPATIYITLSEVMNGMSPKATVTSGDATATMNFMRNGDYQHFMLYSSYYFTQDLKDQIAKTGEFALSVTLNNGDVLPTVTYRIKKAAPAVTATFDDAEGTVFAGLPDMLYFSLSEAIQGPSPSMLVNGTKKISCFRNNNSYQNFYAFVSAYVKGELLDEISTSGKFTAQVVLNDGTELDAVEFLLVGKDISWEAQPGYEDGKSFPSLPDRLAYTTSEAIPAGGKFTSGIMLGAAMPSDFSGWDIEIPCTVDGTSVVFDLSTLNERDIRSILDAGEFTAGLRLKGKELSASYKMEVRTQTVTLGYCNDEFGANDILSGTETAASGTGAAIRIPAAKLESMKGGTISRLRIGMGSGMERVYAWIRPSLSKPAIVMKAMDTSIDGWQEIVFDTPYVITGEEIFIGYSGYQPAGVKAVRTGGTDHEDGCWLGTRDNWEDCSLRGLGALYIQAICEAVLPDVDLGLDNVSISKRYYKSDETVKAILAVCNSGSETINGYTISWSIDGGEPAVTEITTPLASDKRAEHHLDIPLEGVAEGIHTLVLRCAITDADKSDEVPGNDASEFVLPVYTTAYPRTVLMENFTTVRCSNCPNGHASMAKATADRDDVAWVAHHVGFYTDIYTIDESNAFLDFNVAGAPSLMLDRTVVYGSNPPFTIGYTNTTQGGEIISDRIDMAKAVPAFATLSVDNTYDEDTRELTISISGEKNGIFSALNPECNLSVFLTENGLEGEQAGSTTMPYVHNNVLRSIETATFGDPVEWDGDIFSKTMRRTLDQAWIPSNMKIIAFLNKPFNADDINDCQVLNTAQVNVKAKSGLDRITDGGDIRIADGVITSGNLRDIEVFNAQGMRISNSNLSSGLYIVKATDASGGRTVIKSFIK